MNEEKGRQAMKVSRNNILCNLFLSAFKLFAGLAGHSAAMISDAVDNLSDAFSTVIVMIGIRASTKKADRDHPYGHERFECVAAIVLAVVLCLTGLGIGLGGLRTVLSGDGASLQVPTLLPLFAAILSIFVKEAMYWYTKKAAKKLHSGALMADALHHRSDVLTSLSSFLGIFGARLGLPLLDPLASVVICLFILKTACDIFLDAISKMTDKACDQETEEALRRLILEQEAVLGIDLMRTRLFGDKIYVDVELQAPGDMSLTESHAMAHTVHDAIEETFPLVKHCMVHVNPTRSEAPDSEDRPWS